MEEVVNEMNELTMKQQKFADEYIISGNATQAYLIAYPNIKNESTASSNSSRMLRNDKVKSYIDARLEELQSKAIADQQEVLEYLTSTMRGETQDEELLVVGHGMAAEVQRHERRSDTGQRTKAAELLGKRYRLWIDRQEVTSEERVQIVNDLDD